MQQSGPLTKSFATVLAVLFAYVTGSGGERTGAPPASAQSWADACFGEFSQGERQAVAKYCLGLPRCDYLERSASAYVAHEGFKTTEIMGPLSLAEGDPPKLLARRDGKIYVLALPTIDVPLDPGLYWTEGIGSAWTVILPEGKTTTYWVEREL